VQRFGSEVLKESGDIDRRQVAQIVFADDSQRHALEAIVFPWIGDEIRRQLQAAQSDPTVKFLVLDAAIMLEAGWNSVCDRLVYIDAPREVRLERMARWRGLSPEEVEARERAQLPLSVKANRADHTLDNSGTPEALTEQVERLLRSLNLSTRTLLE
jgi:dephospho-CoA kinase